MIDTEMQDIMQELETLANQQQSTSSDDYELYEEFKEVESRTVAEVVADMDKIRANKYD